MNAYLDYAKTDDLLDKRLSTHMKDIRIDLNENQKQLERRLNSAIAEVSSYV